MKRTLANEGEREMGERSQVTTGAHASLLRHRWIQSGVEHRGQGVHQQRPRTREAFGNDVCPQQHHRPRLALRQERTDAARVTAHEIHLELIEAMARDRDVGQLAESGGHSVRDGTAGHERADDVVGALHAHARGRRELDGYTIERDGNDVVEREGISIERHAGGHARNVLHALRLFKGGRSQRVTPARAIAA